MASVIYVLFIQAKEHILSISKFQQTPDKKDWVTAEAERGDEDDGRETRREEKTFVGGISDSALGH